LRSKSAFERFINHCGTDNAKGLLRHSVLPSSNAAGMLLSTMLDFLSPILIFGIIPFIIPIYHNSKIAMHNVRQVSATAT
jgi:hypothetical protein